MASLAITAIVVGLAGAGVSAYGQYQQGKQQDAIAQFNATQQEQQAKQQLLAMQAQVAQQKTQAEQNFKLRTQEAQARVNNAKAIENQVVAQDAIDRRNLRARREEFTRLQSEQRSAIAASGAAESTGTPLDLLAETAAKIQQDQEEQQFVNETQRRTLLNEAAFERLGGRLALAGATLDRDSAVAAAGLRDVAARGEYLAGKRGAEITRLVGKAERTASTYRAGATLLNGVSSAASYGTS